MVYSRTTIGEDMQALCAAEQIQPRKPTKNEKERSESEKGVCKLVLDNFIYDDLLQYGSPSVLFSR